LILRTGRRELREYLLRSIVERYRVHMFTGQDITWEAEYVVGFTRCDNTLDDESLVASAKELTRRDPLAGVMTWDESRTPQAASIAAALGLPGGDPAAIERCRNKHLTRQALAAAGVPQPRSIKVTTPEQAEQAARQIGYPVVVKPSDLALSMGVARADNPEQLAEQVAFASAIRVPELPDYRVQVLIEEYAEGAEISVDSVVHDGRLTVLCVAHKVTGYEPYFIEVGHMVHGDDPRSCQDHRRESGSARGAVSCRSCRIR
jgi:biotin carboxylase